jgi:Family of unknown function (DUF5955)
VTREQAGEPQQPGIVISGGTVNIGALAQGSHARASQVVRLTAEQRDDLAAAVRELLGALRQHQGELTDAPDAQRAAEDAAAELSHDEPDTSRVRRLLDRVVAAAGPVAEIAAAVNAVQRAITGGW